jgi:hypothetical protein
LHKIVAAIVDRGDWNADVSHVGYRKTMISDVGGEQSDIGGEWFYIDADYFDDTTEQFVD